MELPRRTARRSRDTVTYLNALSMVAWEENKMRTLTLVLLVSIAAACSSDPTSGGGGSGGVPLVVGSFCDPSQGETDTVARSGNDITVDLYENVSEFRDVAGSDGMVRRQERRSCQRSTCIFRGAGSAWTDGRAISECQLIT